jgi:hypothetical protein
MEVFQHHLYEYRKGLRRMVLHTAPCACRHEIEEKLRSCGIHYHIAPVTSSKINVFFGDADCVDVIRSFGVDCLSHLTHEQDFILGALLGYDLILQSKRYLERRDASERGRSDGRGDGGIESESKPLVGSCLSTRMLSGGVRSGRARRMRTKNIY